ncbi:MAG: nucleotidyltransferase domain-containing protein [Nitrospirota bacterium]
MRRYNDALRKLGVAVDFLYKEGAKEVYLFGSITNAERFTEHSDIDIAVRGIDGEKHLDVEGKLADILCDLEYDILFLEEEKDIRREIMNRIKEEAILWKPSL